VLDNHSAHISKLKGYVHSAVVDGTGLKGRYNFTFHQPLIFQTVKGCVKCT